MYIGIVNKIGFSILLYSIALISFSQPVHIGEKLPNIDIDNIQNFDKSKFNLTDLIGQNIILDFGNIGCSSCIKNIAKLDSLKQDRALNLNVFWITNNTQKQIRDFLLKNKIGQHIKIPIIAGDSVLSDYFPHNSIPHYAWIDKRGILIATTSSDFITRENLGKFSSGKKVDFVFKTDSAYDYTKMSLKLNAEIQNQLPSNNGKLYYSALFSYVPNIPRQNSEMNDSINGISKTLYFNASILNMYLLTYGQEVLFLPKSHIVINIPQKEKIDFQFSNTANRSIWEKNNTYCYEAIFPLSVQVSMRRSKVLTDLNSFFGLVSEYSPNKEVNCWILKRQKRTPNISPKTNRTGGISMGDFLEVMNNTNSNPPVLDESGLSENEKKKFMFFLSKDNLGDFDYVNSILNMDGFNLIKARRKTNVFELKKLTN